MEQHKGAANLSYLFGMMSELLVPSAPTALALTTSLLATSLSKADCKRHIAVFSAATPIGALVFYTTLYYFGATQNSELTGLAMLVSVSCLSFFWSLDR
jgi:zinc transporter 9